VSTTVISSETPIFLYSTSGEFFRAESPFPGVEIAPTPISTQADVTTAVSVARSAQTTWSQTSLNHRIAILDRYHDLILEHQDELASIIQRETGKARSHAVEEILQVAMVSAYYAKNAKKFLAPDRRSGVLPVLTKVKVIPAPRGVVGIISPWNYPFTLSMCDILPAILAGNTVVLRPDEQTMWSAIRGLELLFEAGLTTDVVTMVSGPGPVIGTALIDQVDHICFTGSTATGRIVGAQAGARLIGVSLELGGKNPMIVCADANLEKFLDIATRACFTSAGQLCVSTERMYIQESIYEKFLAAFVVRVRELVLGAGVGWGYDVGSLVGPAQLKRVTEAVAKAVSQGAKVEAGGNHRPEIGPYVYEPTVLSGVTNEMQISTEEVFGPCVYVESFKTIEQAIALANDSSYGLSSSVITTDLKVGSKIAQQLRTGSVNINEGFAPAYGSVHAPMGGMGTSGIERRHGIEGLIRFTQPQTIATAHLATMSPKLGRSDEQWSGILVKFLQVMKALRLR
jgi:succinate-semialdehyde dehydrogenase / glutarate-semialdehyde dehydrogenase